MTDGMVGRTHRDDKLIRGIRMTQVHAAGKSCQLDRNSSAYGLDRMVIVVDDLDRAVQDYRALGFTVTPPQQVEGSGVRRSCIFFANTDTHLELVSSRAGMAARVLHGLKAVGFTHLRRDALARRALARALKRETSGTGTDASSPAQVDVLDGVSFRRRHQPEEDFFSLLTADALPQQKSAQNPEGDPTRHANGVTGIATVTVAVKRLERKVASCSARLGVPPFYWLDSPLLNLRTASFALGGATLKLAQPTGAGAVNDYLKAHGEGPCALTLQTTASTRRLDDARTHGLRLELIGDDVHAAPKRDPNRA